MADFRVIASARVLGSHVFMLHEVEEAHSGQAALVWYPADLLSPAGDDSRPTGRTWRLNNKTGNRVSALRIQCGPMRGPSHDAFRDGVQLNYSLWPAVTDQASLDAAARALVRWHTRVFACGAAAVLIKEGTLEPTCGCPASDPDLFAAVELLLLPWLNVLYLRITIRFTCDLLPCRAAWLHGARAIRHRAYASTAIITATRARSCGYCGSIEDVPVRVKYRVCSRCWVVHYCGSGCQLADWHAHRSLCRYMAAQREEAGGTVADDEAL